LVIFSIVSRAVDAIRGMRRRDGEPRTPSTLRNMAHHCFGLLDLGRRTGLMAGVPAGFARPHRRHGIGHDDEDVPQYRSGQAIAHLGPRGPDRRAPQQGDIKTRKSRGTLALPDRRIAALRAQQERQRQAAGGRWNEQALRA
jgi:hypothetical protein